MKKKIILKEVLPGSTGTIWSLTCSALVCYLSNNIPGPEYRHNLLIYVKLTGCQIPPGMPVHSRESNQFLPQEIHFGHMQKGTPNIHGMYIIDKMEV